MKNLLVCLCIFGSLSVQAGYAGGRSDSGRNPAPASSAGKLGEAQSLSNEAQASMDRALAEINAEPTLEDLYYLGRAVAANILAIYKPYTGNQALTRYLNLICQAIVINNPAIGLFNGCYVQILDSPELNAFASPGGHILVTRGFVESTRSEEMLAAIIAHELAHIKLKHGMAIINQMQFSFESTRMANLAYDLSGGNSPAARRLMNLRESAVTLIDTMLINGYSQAQEFEADQEALSLLEATGYNPEALSEVLNILLEKQFSDSGVMGLYATHPSPAERIRNVERWIRYYRSQDTSWYREARFINN